MAPATESGAVVFKCVCGAEEPGRPEDARIGGGTTGAGDVSEMYRRLIQSAPFDRTCQRVLRNCPECGLDYMVQIRVGDDESIIYRCKCGYEVAGAVAERARSESEHTGGLETKIAPGEAESKYDTEHAAGIKKAAHTRVIESGREYGTAPIAPTTRVTRVAPTAPITPAAPATSTAPRVPEMPREFVQALADAALGRPGLGPPPPASAKPRAK